MCLIIISRPIVLAVNENIITDVSNLLDRGNTSSAFIYRVRSVYIIY